MPQGWTACLILVFSSLVCWFMTKNSKKKSCRKEPKPEKGAKNAQKSLFCTFLQKIPVPYFFVNCFRNVPHRRFKRYMNRQWYVFFYLDFVLHHCDLLLSNEEFNLHIEPHFKTTWNKHRAGSSNFVIRRMGAITSHKCFKRANAKYCSLPARCCVFMSVGIPIKCQGILLVAGISFICKTLSQTRRSDIHLIWTWTIRELQNKMFCPEFVNVVEVMSAYQSSGVQNIGQILINTPAFVQYVKANR